LKIYDDEKVLDMILEEIEAKKEIYRKLKRKQDKLPNIIKKLEDEIIMLDAKATNLNKKLNKRVDF
jgi:hypothetical protein